MATRGNAGGRVEIGVVGRPHGVSGAFHVFLHNPSSDLLERAGEVHVAAADGAPAVTFAIATVRRAGKGCVVALAGVTGREQAAALTGARLSVPRGALPEPAAGEYYVADLIGLEVYEGDRRLGAVVGSREQGGVEILRLEDEESELELPLVADYVLAIDLAAARIEAAGTGELPRARRRARS